MSLSGYICVYTSTNSNKYLRNKRFSRKRFKINIGVLVTLLKYEEVPTSDRFLDSTDCVSYRSRFHRCKTEGQRQEYDSCSSSGSWYKKRKNTKEPLKWLMLPGVRIKTSRDTTRIRVLLTLHGMSLLYTIYSKWVCTQHHET